MINMTEEIKLTLFGKRALEVLNDNESRWMSRSEIQLSITPQRRNMWHQDWLELNRMADLGLIEHKKGIKGNGMEIHLYRFVSKS